MPKKDTQTAQKQKTKRSKKKIPAHILLREKYKHLLPKKSEPLNVRRNAQPELNQDEKDAEENVDVQNISVEQSVHVLLKVRSEGGQTIGAHQVVIEQKGSALLGKMGQALGRNLVKNLNQQIKQGVTTYLFLTIREGWNGEYVTYRCLLRRVSEKLDVSKKDFIPEYYRFDTAYIRTWFEIASMARLSREEMNKIFVLSSKRSIMSVITSSATTYRVGVHK